MACAQPGPDASEECQVGEIAVTGVPIPGQELTLAAEGATLWSFPDGSTAEGDTVTWTVPTTLAVNEAETVSITAACADAETAVELIVDHPEGHRTVVVYDPTVEGSENVARAYQAFRDVPAAGMCPVSSTNSIEITSAEFSGFLDSVMACVSPWTHAIVPVYGVPYRVSGQVADAYSGALVSVSLDALLFFGADGDTVTAWLENPVYQKGHSKRDKYDPYVPFGALRSDELIVSRIEGEDADAAIELIERTELAQELADDGALAGIVYVDGNRGDTPPGADTFGSYESGEWNMWGTRYLFEEDGRFEVVWDGNYEEFGTAPAPTDCPDALFYAGWYSYGNYNDCFTWAPGAVGGHLDSYSAGTPRGFGSWSGGALMDGITATYGAVNEPYVAGMPEYDQVHLFLLQGASFGEAGYEATIMGGWMMLWIGDPWYRPFPDATPPTERARSRRPACRACR